MSREPHRPRVVRRGPRLAAVLLGLGLWMGCGPGESAPNLILITIDTLRADRVGAYGYAPARTPVLDALAARGVRFDSATTPLPRTTPALATVMTGLWPHHHGSREVSQPMRVDDTLPALLRRRGYLTVGITANETAGREQGFGHGFAVFRQAEDASKATGSVTTERALALAPRRAGRPLFLWVHYLDPHFPYEPPADWSPQPAAPRCRELVAMAKRGSVGMGFVQSNLDGRSARALEECGQLYDAEIAVTDAEIGRLLDGLAQRDLLEGAVVVITADHGENLGEEGLFFEHGPSLADASLRVPLIVTGPGIEAGVDPAVFRLEDLMPTLLGRLGVPESAWPEMDGQDLSRRLGGERRNRDRRPLVALAESGSALHFQNRSFLRSGRVGATQCVNGPRLSLCRRPEGETGLYDLRLDPALDHDLSARYPDRRWLLEQAARRWGPEQARQRCARDERFKLVERPRLEGGYERSLYDLDAAAGEDLDVAERYPEALERLGALLDAWTAELPAFVPEPRSAGELESLRTLGYVE